VSELQSSLRVERSLEDVAEILGARPADWLLPFARIAVHAGEAAGDRRSSVVTRGPRRTRKVTIDLTDLPPADETDELEVAISWETTGFRWVFPSFAGRIVARREDAGCVVTIEGSYREPVAAFEGQGTDAASVAATASASTLLHVVRTAVEEQARQGA